MRDLIAFLHACLDEDEQIAQTEAVLRDGDPYFANEASNFERCVTPGRVLVEVEAKRGVVDWCVEVIGDRDLSTYGQFGCLRHDPQALAVTLAVETLRLLASPYADHPDYDPAWAPQDTASR